MTLLSALGGGVFKAVTWCTTRAHNLKRCRWYFACNRMHAGEVRNLWWAHALMRQLEHRMYPF